MSISLTTILDHIQPYDNNDPQYHPQYLEPLLNAEEPGEQGICFIIVILMLICFLFRVRPIDLPEDPDLWLGQFKDGFGSWI